RLPLTPFRSSSPPFHGTKEVGTARHRPPHPNPSPPRWGRGVGVRGAPAAGATPVRLCHVPAPLPVNSRPGGRRRRGGRGPRRDVPGGAKVTAAARGAAPPPAPSPPPRGCPRSSEPPR